MEDDDGVALNKGREMFPKGDNVRFSSGLQIATCD
jgi:hypothetical protein